MRVTLMVDGSFCPDTGAGGFGYWIASNRARAPGSGPVTGICENPTEVEMKAICNAVAECVNLGLLHAFDMVLIQTDSKQSIAAFEHRRIPGCKGERDAVAFLDEYVKEHSLELTFRHVKGHSANTSARFAANNHCDERAKNAMRKVRQILRGKKIVQTNRRTKCCCPEPWRLQDLRPLRIPRAVVCEDGDGVYSAEC